MSIRIKMVARVILLGFQFVTNFERTIAEKGKTLGILLSLQAYNAGKFYSLLAEEFPIPTWQKRCDRTVTS